MVSTKSQKLSYLLNTVTKSQESMDNYNFLEIMEMPSHQFKIYKTYIINFNWQMPCNQLQNTIYMPSHHQSMAFCEHQTGNIIKINKACWMFSDKRITIRFEKIIISQILLNFIFQIPLQLSIRKGSLTWPDYSFWMPTEIRL